MDNGNMILPPFRVTDYKQEVHAQVDWVFIKIFTVNPAAPQRGHSLVLHPELVCFIIFFIIF